MENSGPRILVIDDEPQIRRLLKVTLSAHQYDLQEATTADEGLNQIALFRPDVIILDLGLPDKDGLVLVREIREWCKTPIIILSARENEQDKIKALDAGADDYVTKPFGMGELLARIRTALRHTAGIEEEPVLSFGELVIDRAKRIVTVNGEEVKLTPTEYEVMKVLAIHAGKVLTHRQLLCTVWGPAYERENHYSRIYIGQLRRKIEKDPAQPKHILTEPGIGYRLV